MSRGPFFVPASAGATPPPPPVDPVVAARAALHALSPLVEIYADIGRVPPGATPGTILSQIDDQSGNAHHALSSAQPGDIVYEPDLFLKPCIRFPAVIHALQIQGPLGAQISHTFCFRFRQNVPGDVSYLVSAFAEFFFDSYPAANTLDFWTPANGYLNLSSALDLGIAHDLTVSITPTQIALLIDGAAGAPIALSAPFAFGVNPFCLGSNTAQGEFLHGQFYDFLYWPDAVGTLARDSAFRTFNVAAFGTPS